LTPVVTDDPEHVEDVGVPLLPVGDLEEIVLRALEFAFFVVLATECQELFRALVHGGYR
jgi:hypothetical protein